MTPLLRAVALLLLSAGLPAHAQQSPLGRDRHAGQCSPDDKDYDELNLRNCTAMLNRPGLPAAERALVLNVRGNTFDALKKYDLAIADYKEVVRLAPSFAAAYANIALEYCRKRDYRTALQFYEEALKVDPDSGWARYGKGVALSRLGDAQGARIELDRANRSDPEIAAVYKQIGMEPQP
ncbi:tetratricopeptide repeat protein [Scleromatobacter humisilvae]|uniref:Tetratricopeptide repeat protein n=1 Tax=Scleromatobacter humisilvae TaxID=2897159 RepID=A0A9X1YN46_9BURK|nr:tetratricopeptide repeat protein [Scleromatobacter humisilvae]MCK9689634.1 tetratricopeptide repeat protein [Scleromatobacter humisilvae]